MQHSNCRWSRGLLVVGAASILVAACSSGVPENPGGGAGSTQSGGAGTGGNAGSTQSGTGATGTWGGQAGSTQMDPCAGVTCSGHGSCSVQNGAAQCACQPGYHAVGLACEVDQTCAGVQCGDCATCEVMGGVAECVCPNGYAMQGNNCMLDFDPCASAGCTADEYCVPEAHCQPLGACVPRCDCSNCPNCGMDNSDGKWNDWQEYCGAPVNQSPATMACNKPCPSGEGCLPYAEPFCWPLEGCFSL